MVKKIKISRQLNTCNGDVIATQLQHNHNILNWIESLYLKLAT